MRTGARVWGEDAQVVEIETLDWAAIHHHKLGTSLVREGEVVKVVVNWMACNQSLRKSVDQMPGVEYVGLDI